MKDMSVALKAHYALGKTTLALCWKATLTNGTVVTATAHDRDIEYPVDSGVIYLSTAAYTPSDVESGADMAPDNLEVEGFLASPHIVAADVHSGIWDYAAIEIFEVNYRDVTMGRNLLRCGTMGEVKSGLAIFRAELRGLMQRYSRRIVRLIQATCDADLGDDRCGVDLAPFTANATVEAVAENRVITCESLREPLNWYSGGKLTFTSGANSVLGAAGSNLSMEVKRSAGAQITLHEMMPFTVAVGDTFSVYAGCQKRLAEDCIAKFNNVANFRGFPHLPGSRVYAGPASGLEAPTAAPAPSAAVPTPPPPAQPPAPAPGPAPAPSPVAPSGITVASWPNTILQTGLDDEAYWMQDNRWGQGSIVEGTAADQYEQKVGVSSTIGPNGEVAFRMQWRWPDPVGSNEVKGYPAILYGRKPGIYNTGPTPGGLTVRLLDGTDSLSAPCGPTPGTFLPQQLPLAGLKAYANFANVSGAPTGEGHLSYDIWLQSSSTQDHGFTASSITHEIMIPLTNWGGYGAYPSGRNPEWYSHDVTIGGVLFHVYCNKNSSGVLSYNFGSLDGSYGRTGWKFIVFQPDAAHMPLTGEIDIAALIAHAAAQVDSAATPWLAGTEWVSSIELGVEPNEGSGDIVVYDFRVYT